MELKLWLTFLMVCGIPEIRSMKGKWSMDAPSELYALEGSCVVIPCSYKQPQKEVKGWIALWQTGNQNVASDFPIHEISPEFRKRATIPDRQLGKCTLKLLNTRTTDSGPFQLKVYLTDFKKSHIFKDNNVTIEVIRTPRPPTMSVDVGNRVTATCTALHSCRPRPPQISWSRRGRKRVATRKSQNQNIWKWKTTSTLSFVPHSNDFNNALNCTVKYSGRKIAYGSVILRPKT